MPRHAASPLRSKCRSQDSCAARGLSKPPIDDIDTEWTAAERKQAEGFLSRSIVSSAAAVRLGVKALLEETRADELMIVSDIFNHDARLRSYELIAEVAGATQVSRAA